MSLSAGKLKDRIVIQNKTSVRDSFGQPIDTWADFATLWAWLKFKNGSEFIAAGSEHAQTDASIRIRYRADISPAMRIVFGGDIYNIKAVLPSSDKDYIDLVAVKGLNNG